MNLQRVLTVLALILAALWLAPAPALAQGRAEARVIVKFKAFGPVMKALAARGANAGPAGPQAAATLKSRTGLALRDGRVVGPRSQVVFGGRALTSAALAARLAADPDVEYAVPDYRRHASALPNDPLLQPSASGAPAAGQWFLRAPDNTFVSAIDAVSAWNLTTGSPSIVVAVLDTGVRFSHPDLAGKLHAGYDFVDDLDTANDGDGRDADASDPGDWTTDNECSSGEDAAESSWHGTQVAGLIGAATDNGIGIAAVGWQTMLLPVRVLGKCGGFDSDIIAAMRWAAGLTSSPVPNPNPARVINLSLGSTSSCPSSYTDVISDLTAAGVVVVAAAGNEEGQAVDSPANCAGVIAVAAVRHVGTKVGFSNLGPQVAISAPGGNCVNLTGLCLYPLQTTTNSGTTVPLADIYSDDDIRPSLGTSFATPQAAGTAALMLAENPELTTSQVRSLLRSSARAFPPISSSSTVPACHAPDSSVQDECHCTTSTCGAGLLDAGAAVAAAIAAAAPVVLVTPSSTEVVIGGDLVLDGSNSSASANRSVASYLWTITGGAALASIVGSASEQVVTIRTTGLGTVTVRLTVTDNTGASASRNATIVITAPAAPAPRIVASDTNAPAGSSFLFDASSSTAAGGFTITDYLWNVVGGASLVASTSGAATSMFTVQTSGAEGGTLTVELQVTDSFGQIATTTRSVTVTSLDPSPSIDAPSGEVIVGDSVSFDGSGSAATTNRTIVGYAWAITSGAAIAAIVGSSSEPVVTVQTSGSGSFTLELTVTDSAGAQATVSSSVVVEADGGDGGSSGGGAMNAGWLAGLLAAALALRRRATLSDRG